MGFAILAFAALGSPKGAAFAADNATTRRAKIEELTPAQQRQLQAKQDRFYRLPSDEQDRLRRLHEQLEHDPDAEQLRQVMRRYCAWLNTLTPLERAELQERTADERVAYIQKLKEDQSRAAEEPGADRPISRIPLATGDARKILRFMEGQAWTRRDEILKNLPQVRRRYIEQMDEQKQRAALLTVALLTKQPLVSPEDRQSVQNLARQLAPATRKRFEGEPPERQMQVFHDLVHEAVADRRGRVGARAVSKEELQEFFEHELSPADRERLTEMPVEEMQKELRRLYWQTTMGAPAGPMSDRPRRGPKGGPDSQRPPLKPPARPLGDPPPDDHPRPDGPPPKR